LADLGVCGNDRAFLGESNHNVLRRERPTHGDVLEDLLQVGFGGRREKQGFHDPPAAFSI
jgi:hypothetical protein